MIKFLFAIVAAYILPVTIFGLSVWAFFALIDNGLILGLPLAIA